MLITKYFQHSTILLTLILIVNIFIPSQNLRAEDFDPDNYLRNPKINSEVRKLSSNTMARQVFEDNKTSFGVTNDVISFLNNLTGGQYVKQIEIIQNIPTRKWNMNFGGGWGAYEIKNVKKIVSANRSVPVTSRIATVGGNIMNALGVLSVAIDIWDGINGDNAAKLKAIAGTESLVKGYLISEYGGAGMGIAMASTAILGYTISKFYSTVLGSYSGYWWEGYSAYLNKKYRLVRGTDSWVNLAKKGNEAVINKRLYEFWDDAEINARDSYKIPGIFDKQSLYAYNNYRHTFAARYYKDYVHTTLKTYFSRETEKVKIRAEIKAERELKKLQKLIDDVMALQAAINDAEKLLEIDFITIKPQKETIKIGESVMFTVLATNLAGLETNVTDEALDSKTFTGDEPGEFTVTAQYEGKSATANITVVEHDCEENEEWSEDEKRCICKDGFTENDDGVCIKVKKCADNEHWDEGEGDCVCDDGFTKDDKGKCVPEEEIDEDICSIGYVQSLAQLINFLIAENKSNESTLQSYISKFNKEINDQSSDPCNNSIIAYCYYSALEIAARMSENVSDIHDIAVEIIMLQGICPDLSQKMQAEGITIKSLVSSISGLGLYKDKLTQMESRLRENGCDEDEVLEDGEKIVPPEGDPGFIQDGGISTEMPGDGDDNDGDGQQDEEVEGLSGYNVTLVLYDSGSAADDVFSLSVNGYGNLGQTPAGGLRSYGLNLLPRTYTAVVTVVLAPDDVGTYTLTVLYKGESIGSITGSPPQGSSASLTFTVPSEE